MTTETPTERRYRLAKVSDTESEVCYDISLRQAIGINKYGTTVADNPLTLKEWMEHAYLETLDNAIYLKRAISELEAQQDRYRIALEAIARRAVHTQDNVVRMSEIKRLAQEALASGTGRKWRK